MKTTNKIERRAIKGCPTFEIDTNGKVWNTVLNRTIKEHINPAGFSYVILNGRIRTIAYLMKATFFTNDLNICIRHRDGDRTNNRLSNLYTFFDGEITLDNEGNERKTLTMEVDPQTNQVIKFWNSLSEAARDCDTTTNKIKKGQIVNGRKFDYYNATLDGIGLFDYTDGNHLIQIRDEYNNLIGEVESLEDAKKVTGDSAPTIHDLIITKGTSIRGYKYSWKLSTASMPEKQPKQRKRQGHRVDQYNLEGNLIKTYESAREAATAIGTSREIITAAVNGKMKTTKGFVWRWEGEPFTKYPVTSKQKNWQREKVRIDVYDINGEFVGNYATISTAAKELGVNVGGLQKCISGSATRVGNYVARKEGEPFSKYPRPQTKVFYQMKPAEDGNGFIILKEWPSAVAAAKELGLNENGLRSYAYYQRHTSKPYIDGYYYSYATF